MKVGVLVMNNTGLVRKYDYYLIFLKNLYHERCVLERNSLNKEGIIYLNKVNKTIKRVSRAKGRLYNKLNKGVF